MERLPVSLALKAWAMARRKNPFETALMGGEDYELVMTADPRNARWFESRGLATIVGRITPKGAGLRALEDGKSRRVPRGFEHFA
jgi:thiamine monophosphate kinase